MRSGLNAMTREHFDVLFNTYTHNLIEDGKTQMIVDFYRSDGIRLFDRDISEGMSLIILRLSGLFLLASV